MKKTVLSGLSLRVLVIFTTSAMVVIALTLASRLDKTDAADRYTLLAVGLTLVLAIAASVVFLIRLGTLRVILRRLDGLLEKYFRNMRKRRPIPQGDECMQISFALQLLEESMEARDRSERKLRRQERFSASILKVLHQAVIVSDGRGNISLFSQGAEKMLGYSAGEIIGKQTPMLFHDPEEIRRRAEELTANLGIPVTPAFPALVVKAWVTGQVDEREWTYIRKDGSRITVLLSVTVFGDDRDNILCCCVATDITERSQVAAEMSRLANYDPLTQLPNRRLFHDRIRVAISQARREHHHLGLLMIDLDRFKPVNDQYGHSAGDILLGMVAERTLKCLRESDTLARMGGDEFVAILPTIGSVRDAVGVATKIRQSLCLPFELTDQITVNIDCCIGVALYPDNGNDEDSLLKSADDAMYIAKGLGRAQICIAGGAREGDQLAEVREGRSVKPLTWRQEYECGEETIDRQHRQLFEHANAIVRVIGSVSPERVPEMLEQLINEVATHFRDEELILAGRGYEKLKAHVQKHRALTNRALELHRLALAHELPIGEVLSFVMRDVVARHMLTDDCEFFPVLRREAAKPQ
ncbi:MAG: diguanylate cyclase [Candidatus Accumulibacter sp.]|nr:diguanylate cyclase [Accumulibacter sp.]